MARQRVRARPICSNRSTVASVLSPHDPEKRRTAALLPGLGVALQVARPARRRALEVDARPTFITLTRCEGTEEREEGRDLVLNME